MALPIKKETEELKRTLDKQENAGLKGVVCTFRAQIQAITMPSSSRVIASLQTLWLPYLTDRQRLKIEYTQATTTTVFREYVIFRGGTLMSEHII